MAARRNVPRNVSDVSRSVEERDTFVTSVLGGAGRRSPVRWSGGGRGIFLDISRLHLGKWPFMMRYLSRTDGRTDGRLARAIFKTSPSWSCFETRYSSVCWIFGFYFDVTQTESAMSLAVLWNGR